MALLTLPSPKVISPYEGIVASGGLWQTFTTSLQDSMHQRVFYPAVNVRRIKLVYANINQLEVSCPGTRQITAGVRNFDNSITQVTWGGNTSYTMASGERVESDWLNVDWRGYTNACIVRTWTHSSSPSTAGVLFSLVTDRTHIGEWSYYGASGAIADDTMNTNTPSGSGSVHGFTYGPIAVIAQLDIPSVMTIGDSRCRGSNSTGTSPLWNEDGDVCPRLQLDAAAYMNAGLGGDGPYLWQTTSVSTVRKWLASRATDLVLDWGVNDCNNGQTLAQIMANNKAVIESLTFATPNGRPRTVTYNTVLPYTNSSDSWATDGNQTFPSSANETVRQSLNVAIRAGQMPYQTGYSDSAMYCENASTHKWLTDGTASKYVRSDGIHPTSYSCDLIRNGKALRTDVYLR